MYGLSQFLMESSKKRKPVKRVAKDVHTQTSRTTDLQTVLLVARIASKIRSDTGRNNAGIATNNRTTARKRFSIESKTVAKHEIFNAEIIVFCIVVLRPKSWNKTMAGSMAKYHRASQQQPLRKHLTLQGTCQ